MKTFITKYMYDESISQEYHELEVMYVKELLDNLKYVIGISDELDFTHGNYYRKVLSYFKKKTPRAYPGDKFCLSKENYKKMLDKYF